jgi:hypothetical protein
MTVTKLNAPGLYFDGDGLLLQVVEGANGLTKSWILRYRHDGKRRDMGLGPLGAKTFLRESYGNADYFVQSRQLLINVNSVTYTPLACHKTIDPPITKEVTRAPCESKTKEGPATSAAFLAEKIASSRFAWDMRLPKTGEWTAEIANVFALDACNAASSIRLSLGVGKLANSDGS